MRVVVLTTSFPSKRAPYNGVFVSEHARRLVALGHDVTVLAPRVFREDPLSAVVDGMRVRRFRFFSAQKLLVQYKRIPVVRIATLLVSGLWSTLSAVRRPRGDVMHAHWAIPTGLIAVIAAMFVRVPVVVTVHRADLVLALTGPGLARRLMQFTLDRADRVVVVSEEQVAQIGHEFGLTAAKLAAIPMGADTELFSPGSRRQARERLDVPHDADAILFVGGLTQVKGVRELIRAMPKLRDDRPAALLLVGGQGPLAEELEETAAELGITSAVRFLGPLDHDSLPTYMNAADVMVLPSHSEGLPVVLMEAAAAGLPAVVTDVGGSAEIASRNPRSRVIEPGDPDLISSALGEVLSGQRAPDVREPVIEADDKYALDGAIGRLLAIYAGLTVDGPTRVGDT